MASATVDEVLKTYNANKSVKTQVDALYEDVYRYAIPHRNVMSGGNSQAQEGWLDDVQIYDSTAIDSTTKFVNSLVKNITPPETRWQEFVAGNEVPPELKPRVNALMNVATQQYFNLLNRTNFDLEIPESYFDLAAGTSALLIQDYDDNIPATFTAAPATEIVVGEGPSGEADRVWREWGVKAVDVSKRWPGASSSDRISQAAADPAAEVNILESTIKNYSTGKDEYRVISVEDQTEIFTDQFDVSPWVITRYAKVSGEVYGRGTLINALPDIKTANKVVEFVLQNAALAIAGVYTAADDGVINPETVEIAPGVVIPVGFNGGVNGRSLDSLPRSGEFDVSQLVLQDLRNSIRAKLLDFGADTLQTVRSAEEVRERRALFFQGMGSAYGRIKFEMIGGINKRLLHMWGKSGDMPKFEVDGKNIQTVHRTPLANVQADADMDALSGAIARMNGLFPNLAAIAIKPEKAAPWIGEKSGVPQELLATEDEIVKAQEGIGQLAADGADIGALANAAG